MGLGQYNGLGTSYCLLCVSYIDIVFEVYLVILAPVLRDQLSGRVTIRLCRVALSICRQRTSTASMAGLAGSWSLARSEDALQGGRERTT